MNNSLSRRNFIRSSVTASILASAMAVPAIALGEEQDGVDFSMLDGMSVEELEAIRDEASRRIEDASETIQEEEDEPEASDVDETDLDSLLEILEQSVFYDPDMGHAIVTAIVRNNSKYMASQIKSNIILKDADGGLVGVNVSEAYANYLAPGATTALVAQYIDCNDEPYISSMDIHVSKWIEPINVQVEIGACDVVLSDDTRALVEVKNVGDFEYQFVNVFVVLRDGDGKIICGLEGGDFVNLDPGDSAVMQTSSVFIYHPVEFETAEAYASVQIDNSVAFEVDFQVDLI